MGKRHLTVPFRDKAAGIHLATSSLPADPGPDRVPDRVVGSPGVRRLGFSPGELAFQRYRLHRHIWIITWSIGAADKSICDRRQGHPVRAFAGTRVFRDGEKNGRSGEIRTPDPLVPNQMRYQAALHSEALRRIRFQTREGNPRNEKNEALYRSSGTKC